MLTWRGLGVARALGASLQEIDAVVGALAESIHQPPASRRPSRPLGARA
jgi:hypothetical protein